MGTITKALNLLTYFSETTSELGLIDFKKLSGQDKATVHRHLTELEQNGFLEQNATTRKYRLGGAILRLSTIRERTFPTRRVASYWVDRLADQVGELAHCSLIQQTEMSPLYFRDASNGATRVNFSEAEMLPLHATASGLTALAFGPPRLLQSMKTKELTRFTPTTAADMESLIEIVREVRENGYAYSNQAYEADVCSFAVPFFEVDEYAYGAVAIALPASRFDIGRKDELVSQLWKTSDAISRELGGVVPQSLKSLWKQAA